MRWMTHPHESTGAKGEPPEEASCTVLLTIWELCGGLGWLWGAICDGP